MKLINEVKRMQQLAGLLNENQGPDMFSTAKKYWETMIENQPETVADLLVDLTLEQITIDSFIAATKEDIRDSYRGEFETDSEESYLEENADSFPEERLEKMVAPEKLDVAMKLIRFCEELGANTGDEVILHAIKTSAEHNDPDELLTILADTMGGGQGDADPFDGIFTFSDIENAIRYARLPEDMGNMITDDDRVRNLELG